MTFNPAFGGGTNLFLPQETGQVVGYIRKPGKFKLLDYAQIVKSTKTSSDGKPVCLYYVLDPDEPARVVSDQEYAWPDGSRAPEAENQLINFVPVEVRMFRRAYPYVVGEQTAATADAFPVLPVSRAVALQHAMTNKTQRVWSLLDNAANWGNNTADNNSLNGGHGRWASASATEGSPNYLAIKRGIIAAAQYVNLYTNSIIDPEEMRVVISPVLAADGGNSAEITDYLKGSVHSKMVQEGRERGRNSHYGMPDYYGGCEIVVEDASRVSERPNIAGTTATTNRNYIKDPTKAVLLSRVGGLDGVEGAPSFSTLQVYYYKFEMAVEERFESWDKRHEGRVVDQFQEVLTNSRSGFCISGCR